MAGKPQTFSKGQRAEITAILRSQLIGGAVLALALLTGITGLSLWGIKKNVERRLEALVAAQFDEPRVQQVVQKVASEQAKVLLTQQVEPQVSQFKADISKRVSEMQAIVAETTELKKLSADSGAKIASLLQSMQDSQKQAEQITSKLTGIQSDLLKVERGLVEIQYFTYKGRNVFPSPYHERIMKQLNDLLTIALPDPVERARFVQDIEGYKP